MSDWQLIDTAPKNGTWVLMWMKSPWSHSEIVRWLIPDDVDFGPTPRWQVIGDRYAPEESQFTHWMPLPAPPEV